MNPRPRKATFTLNRLDVLLAIDAINSRAEAWSMTEQHLRGHGAGGLIEECSDPDEAAEIADDFRRIAESLQQQLKE